MAGRPRTRHGNICGAYARSTGKPCQAKLLFKRGKTHPHGRCRLHGGMSTGAKVLTPGPKTIEGKARSYAARNAGLQAWRQNKKNKNVQPSQIRTTP